MAASSVRPTTKARMSRPSASLMNSCTRIATSAPWKASITDFADLCVSLSTTPMPCVPSSSLMTTGAPPTMSSRSSVRFESCAKAVTGSPTPSRASSCSERSLSRERPIATDSFTG